MPACPATVGTNSLSPTQPLLALKRSQRRKNNLSFKTPDYLLNGATTTISTTTNTIATSSLLIPPWSPWLPISMTSMPLNWPTSMPTAASLLLPFLFPLSSHSTRTKERWRTPQLAEPEYIVEAIDDGAQHPGANGAQDFADLAALDEEIYDADAGADDADQDFGAEAGADTFDQDPGGNDAEADAVDQDFYEDPLAEFDKQEREDNDDIETPMPPRYNLRSRTNPNNDAFRAAMDSPYDSELYFPPVQLLHKDIFAYVMAQMDVNPEFAVTMTQMSANAGLKKHGKKAEEALLAPSSRNWRTSTCMNRSIPTN